MIKHQKKMFVPQLSENLGLNLEFIAFSHALLQLELFLDHYFILLSRAKNE